MDFVFAKAPEIIFGRGSVSRLPGLASRFGKRVLLVTGASFRSTDCCKNLIAALGESDTEVFELSVSGEPSPDSVDAAVTRYRSSEVSLVVSIGGGSTIDTGKAISAMLLQEGSVAQYLEGMETKAHNGGKVPFIAVPTSSGTGSEATKNAVLSKVGKNGFKRSLRHDKLVPDIAVLDPELTLSCPANVTAACGLDALTQLLEAYVSTKASPMTDALALSGLEHLSNSFLTAFERGSEDIAARENMAYASLLSGIVLANAGLGVVHGFAGPIGGFFPIPHGVVCGTLLGEATRLNIELLLRDEKSNHRALEKYARAGELLSGKASATIAGGCGLLVETLERWITLTGMPRLSRYGVTQADISKIVDTTGNKNNPVTLDREQLTRIITSRL